MANEALQSFVTLEQAVELLRGWAEEDITVGVLMCGYEGRSIVALQGRLSRVEAHLITIQSEGSYLSLGLHPATFSVGPLHDVDPTRGLVPVSEGLHVESDSGFWAFLAPSYIPRPEHAKLFLSGGGATS